MLAFLHKGEHAFVLELKDGMTVLGKVGKIFKFNAKTQNLHLHIKGTLPLSNHEMKITMKANTLKFLNLTYTKYIHVCCSL